MNTIPLATKTLIFVEVGIVNSSSVKEHVTVTTSNYAICNTDAIQRKLNYIKYIQFPITLLKKTWCYKIMVIVIASYFT